MSDSRSSPSASRRSHLPRKLVIVFMLAVDAALGLFYLFQQHPAAPVLGRTLVIDIAIGLAAGLGVRLTLNERHRLLRLLAGAAGLVAGLYVLGLLTNFRLGIGPLVFRRKDVDWFDLSQLAIALLPMTLMMLSWSRPRAAGYAPEYGGGLQVEPVARSGSPVMLEPSPARSGPAPRRHKPSSSSPSVHPRTRPLRGKSAPREPALSIRAPSSRPKWRAFGNRRPQMHFSKQEKHLCPYCLEPVAPNDPRGVVECKICHARHHADCWEITGTCQVPHYNA